MMKIKELIKKNIVKTALLEHEVKALLKEMGFSVPKGIFVDKEMVEQIPAIVDISYPVVAKISSSKIVSKSEVNGVYGY